MATNVILITCHDLGRHLGCYGRSTIPSPNLDQLAAQGVKFEQSYATAPQCSPSRAGLHTGRYPHANGMLGLAHPPFGWELHTGEKTLAERLAAAGYATALVGEQHISSSNRQLGYAQKIPLGPAREMGVAAVAMLSQLPQPFYLEVGFHEPHRPYDWGGVLPDDQLGTAVPGYLPECIEAEQDFAALQGSVRAMDEGVGILLDGLRASGLEDNVWLIFTTDHGVAMPRAKGTLYDPGIETALLLHWPGGRLTGGRSLAALVSNVDIMPTLLEGLALPAVPELQGQSFWSLLQNQPYTERTCIFAEKTYHQYYEPMRGIRTATHKLIVNMEASTKVDVPTDARTSPVYPRLIEAFGQNREQVELYDLTADRWETQNLAGQLALQAIEDSLRQQLWAWMVNTHDPILQGPIPSPYYFEVLNWLQAHR